LNYPQLSNRDIDFYIDKGLKEFYLRPKQMWQMLISIRSVGDLLRKLHGFGAFVQYFGSKIKNKFTGSQAEPSAQVQSSH
jgi:hypothetical protein